MNKRMDTNPLVGNAVASFGLWPEVDFTVDRGEGAWLWSTTGRKMVDYFLGGGPMVLGHSHPKVVAAIAERAAKGTHFYIVNEPALRLAEKVNRLVPCAEAVRFCADGSEANFYALRLARAFTGRTKVLKFDGAYHGHFDYALQKLQGGKPAPEYAGIPPQVGETVVLAPYNDIEATRKIVEPVAHEIAAIIVEPIQRAFLPEPGFLQGLRELADRIGALLVFDEVVTGFRLAMGGAQEYFGVTPHLCAMGKILGGGLPMGAVAGRRDVMELAVTARPNDDGRNTFVSGTLNGNPLSCAAGLAALEALEASGGPAKLKANGDALAAGLCDIAKRLSVPLQVLGHGSVMQIVFADSTVRGPKDLVKANAKAATRLSIELIKRDAFMVSPKIYASLAHNDETHAYVLDKAEAAVRALRDQGLLETPE